MNCIITSVEFKENFLLNKEKLSINFLTYLKNFMMTRNWQLTMSVMFISFLKMLF